jgi:hypothetical protein
MAVRRKPVENTEPETENVAEETEAPASRVNRSTRGAGWGSPSKERAKTVQAPFLDLRTGTHIVKILNDAPTVRYLQHFVGKGKPPAVCYRSDLDEVEDYFKELKDAGSGKGCPLCDVGNDPSYGYLINVVDLSEDDDEVRKWTFGKTVKDQLVSFIEDPVTSPLNRETDDQGRYRPLYWKIKQTAGTDGRRQIQITPLKQADVEDDYDKVILPESQVKELEEKSYGAETLFINYPAKMKEFASFWEKNNED